MFDNDNKYIEDVISHAIFMSDDDIHEYIKDEELNGLIAPPSSYFEEIKDSYLLGYELSENDIEEYNAFIALDYERNLASLLVEYYFMDEEDDNLLLIIEEESKYYKEYLDYDDREKVDYDEIGYPECSPEEEACADYSMDTLEKYEIDYDVAGIPECPFEEDISNKIEVKETKGKEEDKKFKLKNNFFDFLPENSNNIERFKYPSTYISAHYIFLHEALKSLNKFNGKSFFDNKGEKITNSYALNYLMKVYFDDLSIKERLSHIENELEYENDSVEDRRVNYIGDVEKWLESANSTSVIMFYYLIRRFTNKDSYTLNDIYDSAFNERENFTHSVDYNGPFEYYTRHLVSRAQDLTDKYNDICKKISNMDKFDLVVDKEDGVISAEESLSKFRISYLNLASIFENILYTNIPSTHDLSIYSDRNKQINYIILNKAYSVVKFSELSEEYKDLIDESYYDSIGISELSQLNIIFNSFVNIMKSRLCNKSIDNTVAYRFNNKRDDDERDYDVYSEWVGAIDEHKPTHVNQKRFKDEFILNPLGVLERIMDDVIGSYCNSAKADKAIKKIKEKTKPKGPVQISMFEK